MKSIIEEIQKIRGGAPLLPDKKNANRYRLVTFESNGSKTAYYFSSPIYNIVSRKMVDLKFHQLKNTAYAVGSNANITVGDAIRMENSEGGCIVSLPGHLRLISESAIDYDFAQLYPTTNGLVIQGMCNKKSPYTFTIETDNPFPDILSNDRFFALMSERFRPFLTVSCIGTADAEGNIIAPATITYQKNTDCKFSIFIYPENSSEEIVLIEINLYEPKLIQDTTVESKHPSTNNVYGGIGFIGSSHKYGEQWLYSRPDYSRLSELSNQSISHAILHLPRIDKTSIALNAYKVSARFCSLGSTWNTKISESFFLSHPETSDSYINLNITPIITDADGRISINTGFILRPTHKEGGFSIIATGDNYKYPQILEINYS